MARKILCMMVLVFCFELIVVGQTRGYITNINDQAVRLDTMDGRKLLIVILPSQPDTALMGQLTRFQGRHGQHVRIVGVIAPGSIALISAQSQSGYQKVSAAGVLLTRGVVDGDPVGGQRTAMLKYLTRKSNNRQMDRFAEGSKFFLSEKGRLYAQLGRNDSLDSRLADQLIQTMVPGDNRY